MENRENGLRILGVKSKENWGLKKLEKMEHLEGRGREKSRGLGGRRGCCDEDKMGGKIGSLQMHMKSKGYTMTLEVNLPQG